MIRENSFNPRMNNDYQTKNIYKMNEKQLEEENKNLEKELKKLKVKGFKIPVDKTRNLAMSNSPKSQTKSSHIQNLQNSNGKIKIISNYKRTNNLVNESKNESLFDPNNNTNVQKKKFNKNNENSPTCESFLSFNNEISQSFNDIYRSRIHNTEEDPNSRSNSNRKNTSFRNKLNKFQKDKKEKENFISTPNFEIKTSKTKKNLIPLDMNSNFISEKNEKTQNLHTHSHSNVQVKSLIDRLKLCQKVNLPNEKNYFITEKNLKLIKEALSEKESDINNLKSLLNLSKEDFENFQKRYDDVCRIIKELSEEKNIILFNLEKLFQENRQIKENYDDYSFQYNKILIYIKTIDKFILMMFKWFDSFCDVLKYQEEFEWGQDDNSAMDPNNTNDSKDFKNCNSKTSNCIYLKKNSRFLDIFKQIEKFLEQENFRSFNFLFSQTVLKKVPNTFSNLHKNSQIYYDTLTESTFNSSRNFLFSEVDIEYFKMEKLNRLLKSKLYDYESFIKNLTHIYETKSVDLTEVAKDMISTKKRISELNEINENLEKENEYLRISYHNLFNTNNKQEENPDSQANSLKDELNNLKLNNEKIQKENLELQDLLEIINLKNSELNSNKEALTLELKKLKEENNFNMIEAKRIMTTTISADKYNERINHLNMQLSNANQAIQEKEKIIDELKTRLMDLERNNRQKENLSKKKVNFLLKEKECFNDNEYIEDHRAHTYYQSEDSNNKKLWNEYLNDSHYEIKPIIKEEPCMMCRELNKKILKYQMELECLKNIKNYKDTLDITEFMKSNKKIQGDYMYIDLLTHCYNQAKVIENFYSDDGI